MQRVEKFKLAFSAIRTAFETAPSFGFCPVCRRRSVFVALGSWLREDLKCINCRSSARQRAVAEFIQQTFPALGEMHVYEPSPLPPTAGFFKRHAGRYTWSRFLPDLEDGDPKRLIHQDLQSLDIPDNAFDLVVTQDVFEHIAEPRSAFAEVARVLRPGGSHVFTIPWYPDRPSEPRARIADGQVQHLYPPEYHSDPTSRASALVFNRFGSDIEAIISASSGMSTTAILMDGPDKGINGDSLWVFHSTKERGNEIGKRPASSA